MVTFSFNVFPQINSFSELQTHKKLDRHNFKLPILLHSCTRSLRRSIMLKYVSEHCLLEYKKQKVDYKPWVIVFILFPFGLVTGGNFCLGTMLSNLGTVN